MLSAPPRRQPSAATRASVYEARPVTTLPLTILPLDVAVIVLAAVAVPMPRRSGSSRR